MINEVRCEHGYDHHEYAHKCDYYMHEDCPWILWKEDGVTRTYPTPHYFVRDAGGFLREVYPITKASRENRGTVLVQFARTGEVKRIGQGSMVRHY